MSAKSTEDSRQNHKDRLRCLSLFVPLGLILQIKSAGSYNTEKYLMPRLQSASVLQMHTSSSPMTKITYYNFYNFAY